MFNIIFGALLKGTLLFLAFTFGLGAIFGLAEATVGGAFLALLSGMVSVAAFLEALNTKVFE